MTSMDITFLEMAGLLGCGLPAGVSSAAASKKVSICTDTRHLKKGQVFWVLKGEQFDGHQFVNKALESGAAAAVVDASWSANGACGGKLLKVADTGRAFLEFSGAYGRRFNIPKIAVTGSNGKTTTKEMLLRILSRRGPVLGTEKNFNNQVGVPLTLMRMRRNHRSAVIELGTSSHGEIRPLSKAVAPDIGIITNIGYSHTEFLGSPAGVAREKKNITAGFHEGSILIVNGEDPFLKNMKKQVRKFDVVTFGIREGDLRASEIKIDSRGCASFKAGRVAFRLGIPGLHNVYNALAALAVGRCLKIPYQEMAEALAGMKPSGRRMEIKTVSGIRILDDCYNASPASMMAALSVLSGLKVSGRRIAVLGDMRELGTQAPDLHHEVGRKMAQNHVDLFFGLGSFSGEVARGALAGGMLSRNIHTYKGLRGLNLALEKAVRPGDAVLVKGSRAMRMEKVTEALSGK